MIHPLNRNLEESGMKKLVLDLDLEHRTNHSITNLMSFDLICIEVSNLRVVAVTEKETHIEHMKIRIDLSGTHTEMSATTRDSMLEISRENLFLTKDNINTIVIECVLL